MSREQTLRPAVFHILLALAKEDLHGLGVAKAIDVATAGSMTLGPGTLYRSLKEMAREGLITEVSAPEGAEDPRRRFYRISEKGREMAEMEATRLARVVQIARDSDVLPDMP